MASTSQLDPAEKASAAASNANASTSSNPATTTEKVAIASAPSTANLIPPIIRELLPPSLDVNDQVLNFRVTAHGKMAQQIQWCHTQLLKKRTLVLHTLPLASTPPTATTSSSTSSITANLSRLISLTEILKRTFPTHLTTLRTSLREPNHSKERLSKLREEQEFDPKWLFACKGLHQWNRVVNYQSLRVEAAATSGEPESGEGATAIATRQDQEDQTVLDWLGASDLNQISGVGNQKKSIRPDAKQHTSLLVVVLSPVLLPQFEGTNDFTYQAPLRPVKSKTQKKKKRQDKGKQVEKEVEQSTSAPAPAPVQPKTKKNPKKRAAKGPPRDEDEIEIDRPEPDAIREDILKVSSASGEDPTISVEGSKKKRRLRKKKKKAAPPPEAADVAAKDPGTERPVDRTEQVKGSENGACKKQGDTKSKSKNQAKKVEGKTGEKGAESKDPVVGPEGQGQNGEGMQVDADASVVPSVVPSG